MIVANVFQTSYPTRSKRGGIDSSVREGRRRPRKGWDLIPASLIDKSAIF